MGSESDIDLTLKNQLNQYVEAEIGKYTVTHMKFMMDAENNFNKMFPDSTTTAPPETTTKISQVRDNNNKYINRPDLMAECTSIAADSWYDSAFNLDAKCRRKEELFARFDNMWKVELAQTFNKEAHTFDDLKRALADRMEIKAPEKLRLFFCKNKAEDK